MRTHITHTHPARRRGRTRSAAGLALATLAPTLAAGLAVGVGLAAAPAAQAAPANCTTAGLVTTCAFGYTGTPQDWTVPAGVDRATFTVTGASGGSDLDPRAAYRPGGRGGTTISTISVTAGEVLRLFVGGKGIDFTSWDSADPLKGLGGWNGGGNGAGAPLPRNANGAGGGGASDIRRAPYEIANRMVVGGGGGGAGTTGYVGDPDYPTIPNGLPGIGGNGGGGAGGAGAQGANVTNVWAGAGGGHGGGNTAGGLGGGAQSNGGFDAYNTCHYAYGGGSGALAWGGPGAYLRRGQGHNQPLHPDLTTCDATGAFGGGGGGGWYGGGGGGTGNTGGSGGGGGSSYGPAGSTAGPLGAVGAHGSITVSFRDPATGWVGLAGGGQQTSAPTAVLRPAGLHPAPTQDVFYLDANSQVAQRIVTDGVPSPQYNLGAVLFPGSTIAAVWRTSGRLDLFGRGTENALWQRSYSVIHGWGPWTARTPAGTLTSSPTVASPSSRQLHVFFRGTDNMLKQVSSLDGNWDQTPTTLPRGPALDTAPSAVVANALTGRVEVYAGCNGTLCGWSYDNNGFLDFVTVTGSNVAAAPTAAYSTAGHVQVVVRNSADRLILWQNRGGAWKQTDLGPSPTAAGSSIGQAPMSATNTILYARSTQGTLLAMTIAP